MEQLPFLRHESLDAVLAYRGGRPVTVGRFLADSAALATALPPCSSVVNTCADRYLFAVGLAAALLCHRTTLLLPARVTGLWEEIAQRYPGHCEISDAGIDGGIDGTPMQQVLAGGPERVATLTLQDFAFPGDQAAVIAFTSGTTGRQMPHPKSWGSLVRSTRAVGKTFGIERLGGAAILGTVPHQHMYGLESALLLATQNKGAFVADRPFYPGDVLARLEALPRPRILVTTPIHLRSLVADAGSAPPADLLISATAPLSPQLAAAAELRFKAPLREIYGCSECGQIAHRRTVRAAEWECLEGFRLRQDERGTLVTGAWTSEETLLADTIELLSPARFLLHGRTADLVNIAGKRTSLFHLDYHLNAIEGVLDGIFYMPDETADSVTRLAAYVVGAPGVTPEFVIDRLRRSIDAAFLPRPLRFVETLPRDANGKVTRAALRDLATPTPGRTP